VVVFSLRASRAVAATMDLDSAIWSRYHRVRLLGRGGSSEVWLVNPVSASPRPLALKLMSPTPAHRLEWENEASIMRRVSSHSHVLRLVDAFQTPNAFALVSEFLGGGDLFDRVRVRPELHSERHAARVVRMALIAIAHLHAANIVHRDIKPENFAFVSDAPDSDMCLIDFGEAMAVDDANTEYETMSGTIHFCAPEVYEPPYSGSTLKQADMWSMGVTVFLLVAGYPPFGGATDRAVMKAARRCAYAWPAETSISASLRDFVSRLLCLDPAQRLTAAQSLDHPWIASTKEPEHGADDGIAGPSAAPLHSTTLETLLNFAHASKFQRAIRKLISSSPPNAVPVAHLDKLDQPTSGLTESLYSHQLRSVFDQLDTNRDGTLSAAEIETLLAGSSENVAARVRDAIRECDRDGDGAISFDEFTAALLTSDRGDHVKADAAPVAVAADQRGDTPTSAISEPQIKAAHDTLQTLLCQRVYSVY
jgi:calcium-dependent protein kinase